jgi:D-glycero-alpha-D-manno-heptose-7-phosphate kinase
MISEERKVSYQNGSASAIRTKAPLRISFAGGGTDVPPYPEREGGCVLNATIDNYAWGSLRPREDGIIEDQTKRFEEKKEGTLQALGTRSSWP